MRVGGDKPQGFILCWKQLTLTSGNSWLTLALVSEDTRWDSEV